MRGRNVRLCENQPAFGRFGRLDRGGWMAGLIEGEARGQAVLFPERFDDLVPRDALVRVIEAFVAGLDLASPGFVRARPAEVDRPGCRPGDLLRL